MTLRSLMLTKRPYSLRRRPRISSRCVALIAETKARSSIGSLLISIVESCFAILVNASRKRVPPERVCALNTADKMGRLLIGFLMRQLGSFLRSEERRVGKEYRN